MRRARGGAGAGVRLSRCVLAVALLLAGCTDPEPSPTPTPSPSSSSMVVSPSPSDSSSAPPRAETPVEFIKRWVQVHTEMQNTGDTREFRRLSKGCQACEGLADQIDEIYAKGGFVETDGWTVLDVDRLGTGRRSRTYLVEIDNAVTRYAEKAGGEVKTLPAGNAVERFVLGDSKAGLVVTDLAQQSTP